MASQTAHRSGSHETDLILSRTTEVCIQGSGPGNKLGRHPIRTKSATGETQGLVCPPFPRAH